MTRLELANRAALPVGDLRVAKRDWENRSPERRAEDDERLDRLIHESFAELADIERLYRLWKASEVGPQRTPVRRPRPRTRGIRRTRSVKRAGSRGDPDPDDPEPARGRRRDDVAPVGVVG